MKTCTECQRLFPDDSGFCPIDGQKLVDCKSTQPKKDPEDPRVGAHVCAGRYEIWRKVADGGMGRVYQALDEPAGRSVALKILHAEVATDPVAVERFKREFAVSANLPHDHIVEVLAFERTEDDSYALVMEYLEGEELRTLLKREKTISPERVIRMVAQMAIGLAGAHERKVVHRDLKPDNVFLSGTSDGDITKILDFGSVRDNAEGAKKLTVMGTTIGSPYYMSPEQAQGLPSLDHRADVWSAAAIAYECLTGKVPFGGSTGPSILLAILTQDPTPPSEVAKDKNLPETLDLVMERALAKNPDLRQATMGQMADELGQAFGLTGTHQEWANVPERDLAARIAAGLPKAIEAKIAFEGPKMDLSNLDAAFAAGSAGGPVDPQLPQIPENRFPMWIVYLGIAAVAIGLGAFAIVRML